MAHITLQGNEIQTNGSLPQIGRKAPNFTLTTNNLSQVSLHDYKNTRVILNIFPSIDTGTCAASVREFNKRASELPNTKILCISRDLPFAQARFCGSEGISNVETLSDFNTGKFGKDYGLQIVDGPLQGLHSRVVIVIDEQGIVTYTQQVPEIVDEPNYGHVLQALR